MIKNIMMCIGYLFIAIYLGTYMIFLIIMFSAVFSLTRFPPTFQFLLFLEKISTFLLWQESWNFWSHCPVQIVASRHYVQAGVLGRYCANGSSADDNIDNHPAFYSDHSVQCCSSVFVFQTSLETIDSRICTYVLYYNIMLFFNFNFKLVQFTLHLMKLV